MNLMESLQTPGIYKWCRRWLEQLHYSSLHKQALFEDMLFFIFWHSEQKLPEVNVALIIAIITSCSYPSWSPAYSSCCCSDTTSTGSLWAWVTGQLFAVAWRATKGGCKRGIHKGTEAGEYRRRHTPGLSAWFLGITAAHCSANNHLWRYFKIL